MAALTSDSSRNPGEGCDVSGVNVCMLKMAKKVGNIPNVDLWK
jgi:hypothetical protein